MLDLNAYLLSLNKKQLNSCIKNIKELIKIDKDIIKQYEKEPKSENLNQYLNDCERLFNDKIALNEALKIKSIYY